MLAGGGDSEEELDISLLRITLFHEHWQGLLHKLDLATLRSNSAVALKPPATNSNTSSTETASVAIPTELAIPTEPPASVHPSSSVSPAQNLTQPAASSSPSAEEQEQGDMASSSNSAAGMAAVQAADEPAVKAFPSR